MVLSQEEQEVLVEAINEVLPNLRAEIYRTENFDYREQLKRREVVLKDLLERLSVTL